jgi:hypothetical protein
VFQSLLSLEDEQINLVMDAVRMWCEQRNVSIESPAGRSALTIALAAADRAPSVDGLLAAIETQLDKRPLAA